MAWEGSLESSCSAIFGNAMVGVLAENVFGYDLNNAHKDASGGDPTKTRALGSALMLVSFVPWMFCFFSYTLLHWSYARDLQTIHGTKPALSPIEPTVEPSIELSKPSMPEAEMGSPTKKIAPARLGISAAAAHAASQLEPVQS